MPMPKEVYRHGKSVYRCNNRTSYGKQSNGSREGRHDLFEVVGSIFGLSISFSGAESVSSDIVDKKNHIVSSPSYRKSLLYDISVDFLSSPKHIFALPKTRGPPNLLLVVLLFCFFSTYPSGSRIRPASTTNGTSNTFQHFFKKMQQRAGAGIRNCYHTCTICNILPLLQMWIGSWILTGRSGGDITKKEHSPKTARPSCHRQRKYVLWRRVLQCLYRVITKPHHAVVHNVHRTICIYHCGMILRMSFSFDVSLNIFTSLRMSYIHHDTRE